MRDPNIDSQSDSMAQESDVTPPNGHATRTRSTHKVNGINGHISHDEQDDHGPNMNGGTAHNNLPIRQGRQGARQNSTQTNGLLEPRIIPPEDEHKRSPHLRPTGGLMRAKSDMGPSRKHSYVSVSEPEEDGALQIRHGWDNEYSSSEYLSFLHSVSLQNVRNNNSH